MLIPALKRHYRGQKKFILCIDKCTCMNNKDRARSLGGRVSNSNASGCIALLIWQVRMGAMP